MSRSEEVSSTHDYQHEVLVDDIYGQVHPVETPELIETKLKEFVIELEKIPANKKINAIVANEKCPELITNEFLLLFLRCEVFAVDLAVRRYVAYWDKRVEVFGIDRAFQPITVTILTDKDITAGEMGFINLILTNSNNNTEKDDSSNNNNNNIHHHIDNRAILFGNPSKLDKTKYERIHCVRYAWYLIHLALSESLVTQQRGIVFINCPKNAKFHQFDKKLVRVMLTSIQGYLPVRISGIHLCHPPSFFSIIWPIVSLFMSKRVKKRVRVHMGSEQHVLDVLTNQFGLSINEIPTELGGKYIVDPTKFLLHRRTMETKN